MPDDPKTPDDPATDPLAEFAGQLGDALIDAEKEAEADSSQTPGVDQPFQDLAEAADPEINLDLEPMQDQRIRSTFDDTRLRIDVRWGDFDPGTPIANIGGRVKDLRRIRFGRPTPPFKSGPFDDDDGCLRGCFYPLGCLFWVLVAILVVVVGGFLFLGGGDDGGDANLVSSGGIVSSATAGPSTEASSEPTDGPTPTLLERVIFQVGHAVIDDFLEELYWTTDISESELDLIHDNLLDFLDSIRGQVPFLVLPYFDIEYSLATRARFTRTGVLEAFGNTIYECGANDGVRIVVCPAGVQSMAEAGDEVWLFAMSMDEMVPQASPDRSFIYSIVFDSDGDPANDWQFFPPFDFDLFQGADRWYQLAWDHFQQQWTLSVTQVDGNQSTTSVPSAVRAVIQGDTIVFFIPASEFALDQPPYRMTAFGHDGFFSENDRGADVTGVDPTEPLTVPPSEVFDAMPEDRAQ